MNQNVHKLMLARFLELYGEPTKPENVEAFLGEYHHALKGYSAEAIRLGADQVIRENTFRAWPTVGECAKACQAHYRPAPSAPQAEEARREPTPEEQSRVLALAAEFRKSVKSMALEQEPKRQRPAPDRRYFAERGWNTGAPLTAPKRETYR
jgi:hypothetical protein